MHDLLKLLSQEAVSAALFLVTLNLVALLALGAVRPAFALYELRQQRWREKNWHKC